MPHKDPAARKKWLKAWREANLDKHRERDRLKAKRYLRRLRQKTLELIANSDTPKCVTCGCDKQSILEINHIYGNGGGINRELRTQKFYRAIMSGNYDKTNLDIRCKLCNIAHYIALKYGFNYDIKFIR